MVIRLSTQSVWLNGRVVLFPLGTSAHAAYASLAKHTSKPCVACERTEKKTKPRTLTAHPPLEHPLEAIAHTIAWRLANPTNHKFMARAVKRAKGSNQHKATILNDGGLYGFTPRALSETDLEEIRGVCSLVLAERGNPETFDFATWKALFSESRKVLGMKRKVYRENLVDSLDAVDFHSELALDAALIECLREEREEEERRANERKARTHEQARVMIRAILAARRADQSRKARFNMLTACRYLRKAIQCTLGNGHGHELTRTAAYKSHETFSEYLSQGEEQLAREREEESARFDLEETTRAMYAIAD